MNCDSDSTLPLLPGTFKTLGRPDGGRPCIEVDAYHCPCGRVFLRADARAQPEFVNCPRGCTPPAGGYVRS